MIMSVKEMYTMTEKADHFEHVDAEKADGVGHAARQQRENMQAMEKSIVRKVRNKKSITQFIDVVL
jgi:hypothetical protein